MTVSRNVPRLAAPRRVSARPSGVTVPRVAFDLVELDPTVRAAAGSVGVQVGAALELPVSALDALQQGLGERVEAFFLAARALWSDLDVATLAATLPSVSIVEVSPVLPKGSVLVRVPLIDVRQKDSRTLRVDLAGQFAALEHVPVLRPALDILDTSPDWDALAGCGVLEREGDRSSLTLEVRSPLWPLELGAAPCPGELRRSVRLEVSHAGWRDRRVRRLLRVRVEALQVWPDPLPFRC